MHDVIVIGAGSAGCAVAGRLTEAGLKVLLLEAGGPGDWDNIKIPAVMDTLMDSPVDWGYRTVPQDGLLGRKIFMVRGKCLGGSSALNFMVYMRGNRGDYDRWRDLGNDGWGYDDVLPLFRRSEANERFQDDYHGSSGPLVVAEQKHLSPLTHRYLEACAEVGIRRNDDFNGAEQEGAGLIQATIGKRGRCSAKVAFLDPVMDRSNLTVVTRAQVTRLILENGRAVGVSYVRNGVVETARAGEIVLSAGALNSPQLLMLSGIGPAEHLHRHGIGVVHDLPGVGQNLQDHMLVAARFEIDSPITMFGMSACEFAAARAEYLANGTGPLASNIDEAGAHYRCGDHDPADPWPDIQLHFEPVFVSGYYDGTPPDRHGFLMFINVSRPGSRGTLTLNSGDPLDRPLIDPNYLSDPRDLDLTIKGLRRAIEIGEAPAFRADKARLIQPSPVDDSDEALADYVRRTAGTVWHPSGTCKMGRDPLAVVDDRLRVRGIAGLRVADASIMPTIPSGNINAPCIMIGEKAAELIVAGR